MNKYIYIYVNLGCIKLEDPRIPRNSQQKDSHILSAGSKPENLTGNNKAPKLSYPDWTQAFAKANDLRMPEGFFEEVPHKLQKILFLDWI